MVQFSTQAAYKKQRKKKSGTHLEAREIFLFQNFCLKKKKIWCQESHASWVRASQA